MKHKSKKCPKLISNTGQRKFMNEAELNRFLNATEMTDGKTKTLCMCLFYTGCKISEALRLTADCINLDDMTVMFRKLKKQSPDQQREVPVPEHMIDDINLVHGIRKLQQLKDGGSTKRLWTWSRTTAWRHVSDVIKDAGINGHQATSIGIRHGFGIMAVHAGVPLNVIKKWMGHSDMALIMAYADEISSEERETAEKIWQMMTTKGKKLNKLPLFDRLKKMPNNN